MGCNCGGTKSKVRFQVRFKDGSSKTYESSTQATMAIRAAGGGVMKAVPA